VQCGLGFRSLYFSVRFIAQVAALLDKNALLPAVDLARFFQVMGAKMTVVSPTYNQCSMNSVIARAVV